MSYVLERKRVAGQYFRALAPGFYPKRYFATDDINGAKTFDSKSAAIHFMGAYNFQATFKIVPKLNEEDENATGADSD